jgi:hypothetical protein|tara:strand:- start:895 stop:1140 length:246 start_codon:yes stop_codon:yes gene_type:complete
MVDESKLWKSISDIKVSVSTNNQKLDEIFRWMQRSDEDHQDLSKRIGSLEAFKMAVVWLVLGTAAAASAIATGITAWIKGS